MFIAERTVKASHLFRLSDCDIFYREYEHGIKFFLRIIRQLVIHQG